MSCGWTGGQYSVFRVILGLYLMWRLAFFACGQAAWFAGPAVVGAVLCALLVLGWLDRAAAVGLVAMAVLVTALPGLDEFVPGAPGLVGGLAWVVLPVLHAMTPPRPHGSLAAWGRADPAGLWRMPRWWCPVVWLGLCLGYVCLGVSSLVDPSWSRGAALSAGFTTVPIGLLRSAEWLLLGGWLGFAVLAIVPGARRWIWLTVLAMNLVVLPSIGQAGLAVALLMFHLAAFIPAWLPPRSAPAAAPADATRSGSPRAGAAAAAEPFFYDGNCGLCHCSARFVLAEDPGVSRGTESPSRNGADRDGGLFVLSPLQGDLIKIVVPADRLERLPDSIVVCRADGAVLTRSGAVLHILDRLGGAWRVASWVGAAIPRSLRDAAYDGVARIRYRLFARPEEACPVLPPHLRGRFRY